MGEWRPHCLTPEEAMNHAKKGEDPPGVKDDDIVFVTWDMRIKDGKLAERDRLIFQQMREGKTVPLFEAGVAGPEKIDTETDSIPEMIRKTLRLGEEAVARTKERAEPRPDIRYWVDREVAGYVRNLRVVERGTWRYVAGKVAERYGMSWGEDQPTGMELCEISAKFYGEDFMEGVWN